MFTPTRIGAKPCFCHCLFWRYWRSTHDRFFVFLALSFWIEAANRVHIALAVAWNEETPQHYLVRLLAFGLILFAIWDKNRQPRA